MSKSGNIKAGSKLHAVLKDLADAENRSIVGQIKHLLAYYIKHRKQHAKDN